MNRAVLSPPNAILFVFDPTNKDVVVPPYVDGELTAATANCVSVGTQADVDGDTEVSLETTPVIPCKFAAGFPQCHCNTRWEGLCGQFALPARAGNRCCW
jgi:hypothetical protein